VQITQIPNHKNPYKTPIKIKPDGWGFMKTAVYSFFDEFRLYTGPVFSQIL